MLCTICGKVEVYSENSDHCIICWMTGAYFEQVLSSDERSNMLERIRELEGVIRAEVWHNGGGGFVLGIILADGRLVQLFGLIPLGEGENMIGAAIVPMIPPKGAPWSVTVLRPVEGENEWEGEPTVLPDAFDDDELVEQIKAMI